MANLGLFEFLLGQHEHPQYQLYILSIEYSAHQKSTSPYWHKVSVVAELKGLVQHAADAQTKSC